MAPRGRLQQRADTRTRCRWLNGDGDIWQQAPYGAQAGKRPHRSTDDCKGRPARADSPRPCRGADDGRAARQHRCIACLAHASTSPAPCSTHNSFFGGLELQRFSPPFEVDLSTWARSR